MKKKCICEICTCGRHRCPHRPHDGVIYKTDEPCVLSEYKTTYHSKPMEPTKSFKPKQEALHSDEPCEDRTTHRVDYIKHPMQRPFVHNPDEYKKPPGDIDTLTSYKKEYIAKRGTPAKAIRHEAARQQLANFEGNPTYKDDYKQWAIQRTTPYGAAQHWHPPTQKLDSETTVNHDYRAVYQPPRSSMKPIEANRKSSAPLEDLTGYRDYYRPFELPKKEQRIAEQYKPPSQQMDSLTTNKNDFRGHLGGKTESFKPEGKAFTSEAPFEDSTTFKNDYRKWDAKPRSAIEREGYRQPEGEIDTTTSYNVNYRKLPFERVVGRRPNSATKLASAPFDDTTTHHEDYKQWNAERSYPKARDQYVPMSAPFEGLSTQKAHYIPHQQQRNRSFKPDGNAYQSNSPFVDATNYRQEYTEKRVGECPAGLLQTSRTHYKFDRVNSRGHQLYAQLSESITPLDISNKRVETMSYA